MERFQGTFKRYEKKYLISEKKYQLLREKLKNRLHIDEFGKVTICNIYFDTPDHHLIRKSLEKPVYKEKLRLRSYGIPSKDDGVFVELKKKYKGIVYKRREKMEITKAEDYLYENIQVDKSTQITKEIDWFIRFYNQLLPAMYISYDRIALCSKDDSEFRVTFDNNIRWREEELFLTAGIFGTPLLEEGERLMEVKIPGTMPIWFSHILDELEVYPISFSKYGRGYEQSLLLKQNEIQKTEEGVKKYA